MLILYVLSTTMFQYMTLPREYCKSYINNWKPKLTYLDSDAYILSSHNNVDRYIRSILNSEEKKNTYGILQQDNNHKSLFILYESSLNNHVVASSLSTHFDFCSSVHKFNKWYNKNYPDTILTFTCPYCVEELIKSNE